MNFLAGVDEAGLGPILGPLVVAGVAMAGPEGVDPWKLLQRHVSRRQQSKERYVADSKKVTRAQRKHLGAALVFWTALHGGTTGPRAVAAAARRCELLQRCPWRGLGLRLPRGRRGLGAPAGQLVARSEGSVSMLDIAVRPVDVEEWNS
jgi:hypothetical protein